MQPSDVLIDFLKGWEGPIHTSPREDPCAPGVFDIGYGHVCAPDHPAVSMEWCTNTLRSDVERFAVSVSSLVTATLSQFEFDALVSFAYNAGAKALSTSTLLRMINALDFEGAADQFALWNKSGGKVVQGLVKRRAAERAMFVSGDYSRRP